MKFEGNVNLSLHCFNSSRAEEIDRVSGSSLNLGDRAQIDKVTGSDIIIGNRAQI